MESGGSGKGSQPETKGSCREWLWEPWGLPYLRQEGQEGESLVHKAGLQETGEAYLPQPGRFVPLPPPPAWAAGLPRPMQPGQGPFRSLLNSTLGLSHPWGPSTALAIPGSMLYILKTSFYSL